MSSTSGNTIETRGLHKVFGDKVALEDLTLAVSRGEVFGFLGPNGAGKTTAVKMLRGLGLLWVNAILLLGVSLLGGAMFSTLANGVLVFGMYGIAFLGGWIEHIGAFIRNQTAINIGVISSLMIPSEALWKRAAYEMQSPIVRTLGFSPFAAPSVPSSIMIVYAVLYAAAALVLAIRQFNRRDL